MRRLKTILQSKYPIKVTAIIIVILDLIFLKCYTYQSNYSGSETKITGIVTNIIDNSDYLTIYLQAKELILVKYYYQINAISIVLNLFLVPLVSFLIFPLSLLTLILPKLDGILSIFITIIESISNFCSQINFLTITLPKCNFIVLMLYYFLIFRLKVLLRLFRKYIVKLLIIEAV